MGNNPIREIKLARKRGKVEGITLFTAWAFHAPVAVMLVPSFSPEAKWHDDFETFCAGLDCKILSDNLCKVPGVSSPRLLLGLCSGNKKYLDVE